jgi:hypothetical protein
LRRRAAPGVAPRRSASGSRDDDGISNNPSPSSAQDWRPGRLQTYVGDPLTLDPDCGIPVPAHSAWLCSIRAGERRCVRCGHRLAFDGPRHPLVFGVFDYGPAELWLMAMCARCAVSHPGPAAAADALAAHANGRHTGALVFRWQP